MTLADMILLVHLGERSQRTLISLDVSICWMRHVGEGTCLRHQPHGGGGGQDSRDSCECSCDVAASDSRQTRRWHFTDPRFRITAPIAAAFLVAAASPTKRCGVFSVPPHAPALRPAPTTRMPMPCMWGRTRTCRRRCAPCIVAACPGHDSPSPPAAAH